METHINKMETKTLKLEADLKLETNLNSQLRTQINYLL